ncbi:hypothetical protein CQW23_03495 [Capsicum baccatum]|uniref:TF-B3 domain-containing protein n=1 Tax=Capsicum baccatum TaxID=33114 RepID=A0A2G2XC34_CAPBA|nr:hypothetical protein CQW23_03495 [Capsicum baccatum]
MKKNKNRKANMVKRRDFLTCYLAMAFSFPFSQFLYVIGNMTAVSSAILHQILGLKHIPDEFVMKYGADLRDLVFLEVPTGAIWEVKLQNSNGMKWLKEGWNKFKEYYSIGCGYFLLFQYKGNSHFFVFIFDLSASEIEYPSGPNEDITPEKFVNLVGDASHRKKTQKNACDDDFLRNKTAKVADRSYSEREKSVIQVSHPSCPPERQEPNRVKLEKPDVEEDLDCATQNDKEKLLKLNMEKNLYCAADKGNGHCNEVLDPSASKMANTTKCTKRKYSISLEASGRSYPLRSKQVKLEQSKGNGSPYSVKQRSSTPVPCRGTQSERKESTEVQLEKANTEEDFCCAVQLEKANTEEDLCCVPKAKRVETNMEKLVKQGRQHNLYGEAYKFKGHCNEVPVVVALASKVTTINQHSKQKTITSLDASICRYPLRSKQVKDVKTENGDVEEHCSKIPVVDPSVIKKTTTNQHSKQKTTTTLDASICRYPLRSKQVKDVKTEIGDVEEHCSKIPVVDPLVIKKTTTNQHHEKKTSVSLDTSHCRYPLRSQQLKEVKLGKPNAEEDLLSVAQKAKMKKANNVKLEKGDVEECNKEMPVGDPSTTKKKTTNRHHQKKTSFSLDTSHCRYPLRSKQLNEVKLGQWEAGGNIHNKLPKKTVAADSSYCKTQNSGLPASSRSCKPIRVKLEKPDNLFCAAEKAEGKETINVKLETGDMEVNLNSASYKGTDSTASEMTRLGKKKMLPSEKHNWGNYCNPHFIVSMQPAYVSQNFQLDIPVNFFKKYIREEETIINLRVSNGRIWRAKLFNIQSSCVKIQASGWRDFVLGNSLKEHDTCVFELFEDTEPVLDVTIFRAMTPAS